MAYSIRDIRKDDIHATADLLHHVWHDVYASFIPAVFVQERFSHAECLRRQTELVDAVLSNPQTQQCLIAADDAGGILGFCYTAACPPKADPNRPFDMTGYDFEIVRLYLYPHARGRGIGRHFLQETARWCAQRGGASCCLWSFDDNPYTPFYLKNGAQAFRRILYDYAGQPRGVTAYGWQDFAKRFYSLEATVKKYDK